MPRTIEFPVTGLPVLAIALMLALPTAAQDQYPVLEEVVVTAQKRAQSLQDVPLAVSAFDGDFLRDASIKHLGNLIPHTPGLYGSAEADTQSVFNIRGVGTFAFSASADNSVGVFIDDVSVGKPVTSKAAFFDVERVEVVKGPQGTLFGRNTSAGAINIITKKPDLEQSSFDLTAGFGNQDQQLYEAIGNFAVNDRFGIRFGVRNDERDGTHTARPSGEELNDRNHTVVRLGLRYLWSDAARSDFSIEQFDVDTLLGYAPREMAKGGEVPQNIAGRQQIESWRASLRNEWDLSDSVTLTSLTGFYTVDMVAVPIAFTQTEFLVIDLREPWEIDQWSQEFRLSGTVGKLDWFVGASYFSEDADVNTEYHYSDFTLSDALLGGLDDVDGTVCDNTLNSGGAVIPLPECLSFGREPGYAKSSTNSYAVYGDVAWHASDKLTVTVGARMTFDKKKMEINNPLQTSVLAALLGDNLINVATPGWIEDDDSWNSLNPRLALTYQMTDAVTLYGSVATGYKSGGYNKQPNAALGSPMQIPAGFNEEDNLSYELGMKSTFWSGRAQLNAAAFFSDYSDLQVENNVGLFILIENAADVESKGIELEGRVLLTENFELMASFSHINAEVDKGAIADVGDITGNKLIRTPENSGSVIGEYSIPMGKYGKLTLRGEWMHVDDQFWNLGNTDGQDSYSFLNAMLRWTSSDERWDVSLMGENVTHEVYFMHLSTVLGQNLGIPDIGDLWRLEISARL